MKNYIEKLQKRAARYALLRKNSEEKTGPGHEYRNGYMDGKEDAILHIIDELQEFQKNNVTIEYIRVKAGILEPSTNHKPIEDESSGSL